LLATGGLSASIELDASLEKGQLAASAGDADGAEEGFSRAQTLAQRAGSMEGDILARVGLGEAATLRGRAGEARLILSEAAMDAGKLNDAGLLYAARAALARALAQGHDAATARRVAGKGRRDEALLYRVFDAAMSSGLVDHRDVLLSGLSPSFIASLPYAANPTAQLRSDLAALGHVERLANSEHPLETWLRHATLLAGSRPEAAVFAGALAALRAAPPELSGAHESEARSATPPTGADAGPTRSYRSAAEPPLVVLLCAHADHPSWWRLRRHLTSALRAGRGRRWSPDQISPGESLSHAIEAHVRDADALIVLVSAHLLADAELMRTVETALKAGKRVVPVRLHSTDLADTLLAGLPSLPRNGRPLSTWHDGDLAWADVARDLRQVLLAEGASSSG
jgi:Effector-associated domain 5/TIR domain